MKLHLILECDVDATLVDPEEFGQQIIDILDEERRHSAEPLNDVSLWSASWEDT